jgi:hypothetical protein
MASPHLSHPLEDIENITLFFLYRNYTTKIQRLAVYLHASTSCNYASMLLIMRISRPFCTKSLALPLDSVSQGMPRHTGILLEKIIMKWSKSAEQQRATKV